MKRLIDLAGSIAGIVFLGPVLLATMLAIRVHMGEPIFFSQLRPGLHGKPFRMPKLRTMRDAVGPRGNPMPDSERLTLLGRFLRDSSIDELPSLRKIVNGDMSLIGPRPLLMDYLALYSPEQARRNEIRPVLTG